MEYKRKIFGYECDVYGHLNNANYLHIYEEARADALDKMGFSIEILNEIGLQIYLNKISIDYKKGLPIGEKVIIKTDMAKSSRVSAIWMQEIYNSKGELCNIAEVKGVFVKNGKPTRISKEMYQELISFSE